MLGDYEIFPEDLVDNDIAGLFNCDSAIIKYISEPGGEATYEMLAYEISRDIESRFVYEEGFLHVNAFSGETDEGMYVNISLTREKPVSIPVVLNASDSSFSTSFDTTCRVVFEASIDLFLDAGMALADSQSQAMQVRINTFTFEITSAPDEDYTYEDCYGLELGPGDGYSSLVENPPVFIPFEIKGRQYTAAPRCFSLNAKTYWHLVPADPESYSYEEGESPVLTYEQIERGDFTWEHWPISSLKVNLVMLPAEEDWNTLEDSENTAEFEYIVDDLFDENSLEQISLCCNLWYVEGVTLRGKKHVLKP